MPSDGQVVFEITGDNRGLRESLQDSTNAINRESRNWDNAAGQASGNMENSFVSAFKSIGIAAAASKVGQVLLDIGKQAISAASDLEEVQNVVDVTFGASSAEINAWAKNAINQFGLTETQAKRFASTMGAMLKSSGLAGGEIVEMSESLAGLAADMASFYNLDFDEAFNKIRSGISGETEPLKQLGINMSVANLEAFALAQGIDKAFSKMSQSEQIMLRYQYMMQATADAQGDFARTNDGFANGLRLLQSNFESLKTAIGDALLPIVSDAIKGLNKMLSLLIPDTKTTTVLDDFANIDLDTQGKIDAIDATRTKALELVGVLESIGGISVSGGQEVNDLATGANALNSDAGTNWDNFLDGLDGIDSVIDASDGGKEAEEDLKGLATGGEAVTGTPGTFKYSELPEGIQDLIDKAVLSDTKDVDGKLGAVDKSAGDLTGTDTSGFKYEEVTIGIGELSSATDKISKIETNTGKIVEQSERLTGTNTDGFKYDNVIQGVEELETESGKSDSIKSGLSTINENAGLLSGPDADFKYDKIGSGVEELVDVSSGGTEAGKQLSGLATGAQDVSGAEEGFKFADTANNVGTLIEESTGGTTAGKSLSGLAVGADAVSGEDAGYKFETAGKNVGELISESSGGTEAGNDLQRLTSGANALTGNDAGYKYGSVGESVGKIIKNSAGGEQAGTDLKKVAEGAEKVAAVTYDSTADPIGTIADKIKLLDSTSTSNWQKIVGVFGRIPTLAGKLTTTKIDELSNSLSGMTGDKVAAWTELMDILGSDMPALMQLTGQDENAAATWLTEMKEAANGLDNNDVNSWSALLSLLAEGTPGAGNWVSSAEMKALATAAGMPAQAVETIGDATANAAQKNEVWLETCRRLVQLLPGLANIINTETGEIKGGTAAVAEYVDKWTEGQKYMTLIAAQEAKRRAINEKYSYITDLEVQMILAENRFKKHKEKMDELARQYGFDALITTHGDSNEFAAYESISPFRINSDAALAGYNLTDDFIKQWNTLAQEYADYATAQADTTAEYDRQNSAREEALTIIDEENAAIEEQYADFKKNNPEMVAGTDATVDYAAAQEDAEAAVKSLSDALKELNDYVEQVRDSTRDSIDSTLAGFSDIVSGSKNLEQLMSEAQKNKNDIIEQMNEAKKNGKSTYEFEIRLQGVDEAVPSIQKMRRALEEQLLFLTEYNDNLNKVREMGYDDDLIAELADGSQESATYLYLLANASDSERDSIISAYAAVEDAKGPLVDSLTEAKLKADETFDDLVNKAKEAAEGLNQQEVAQASMAGTVQGIADGIAEKIPAVKTAVEELNAELARLGDLSGLNVFNGLNGDFSFKFTPDGSFATGTDYIPFDNFLAYLHEGEAVLTAEEATLWRHFKSGGASVANSIDYGTMAGAIWDNAPNLGGNVYLDGATVGRVISAQQANSYRALERSGWQG